MVKGERTPPTARAACSVEAPPPPAASAPSPFLSAPCSPPPAARSREAPIPCQPRPCWVHALLHRVGRDAEQLSAMASDKLGEVVGEEEFSGTTVAGMKRDKGDVGE